MAHHQLDELDEKILKLIIGNARMPFLEVARICNVSGAAIHQRIQKLTNLGVIKGSEFIVDTYKIGYQTCALVGISVSDNTKLNGIVDALRNIPEVVECHYTTGKYALFIKIYAHDNRDLLNIMLDKITCIDGVSNAETFLLSLDEIFKRQIAVFDEEASKIMIDED